MANPEHLAILKQGVEVWNKWRQENPAIKPDLSDTNLSSKSLCKIDLSDSDIKGTILRKADLSNSSIRRSNLRAVILSEAKLENADLRSSNLTDSHFINANLENTNISEANLTATNLHRANLHRAVIRGARILSSDFSESNLKFADLSYSNLRWSDLGEACLQYSILNCTQLSNTNLIKTNLSGADITGSVIFGTSRDEWKIDGVKCEYIFFDLNGKIRIPSNRDYQRGEFESLYKHLPTIEYYFEHGFTPVDAVIMDRIVQVINDRHPEFELKLDSFHSRGQPHAVFTVIRVENATSPLRECKAKHLGLWRTGNHARHTSVLPNQAQSLPIGARRTQWR